MKAYAAEFFGTFWLVLGGCGSAVLAAAFPEVGIGLLGVSLAFGLSLLCMAYLIGRISGCHINPAVTIGMVEVARAAALQAYEEFVLLNTGAGQKPSDQVKHATARLEHLRKKKD